MSLRTYRTKVPRKKISKEVVDRGFGYVELYDTIKSIRTLESRIQEKTDALLLKLTATQEDTLVQLKNEIRNQIKILNNEKNQLIAIVERKLSEVKNGDDGADAPSLEEILEAVKPHIKKGEDGKTPSKQELVALIQPLIPKDGKAPKEEVVVKKVLDKIKLPKAPKEEVVVKKVLDKIKLPKAPTSKEIVSAVMDEIKVKIEAELQKMHREIRQISSKTMLGGGGMGTPIKFSFTGDGSTTEFTLPATPSGEGMAIWAHDQSAWLQPGVHFNVSGTAFTTTYTPENGVVIEGILIP